MDTHENCNFINLYGIIGSSGFGDKILDIYSACKLSIKTKCKINIYVVLKMEGSNAESKWIDTHYSIEDYILHYQIIYKLLKGNYINYFKIVGTGEGPIYDRKNKYCWRIDNNVKNLENDKIANIFPFCFLSEKNIFENSEEGKFWPPQYKHKFSNIGVDIDNNKIISQDYNDFINNPNRIILHDNITIRENYGIDKGKFYPFNNISNKKYITYKTPMYGPDGGKDVHEKYKKFMLKDLSTFKLLENDSVTFYMFISVGIKSNYDYEKKINKNCQKYAEDNNFLYGEISEGKEGINNNSIDIIKFSKFIIGREGGHMHMANALGIPYIVILPEHFFSFQFKKEYLDLVIKKTGFVIDYMNHPKVYIIRESSLWEQNSYNLISDIIEDKNITKFRHEEWRLMKSCLETLYPYSERYNQPLQQLRTSYNLAETLFIDWKTNPYVFKDKGLQKVFNSFITNDNRIHNTLD